MDSVDITRRKLLAGGAAIGGAALVSACGGSSSASSTTASKAAKVGSPTAGGGTPVHGGTLTVAMVSGGTAETVNPGLLSAYVDVMRGYNLYDNLFYADAQVRAAPGLALSAEPNSTATLWTMKLRDGVHWHDGKPFSADDVVYAFRGWGQSANFGNGILLGAIDFNGVKKIDRLTVQVPTVVPVADLPALLSNYTNMVPQAGSTFADFKTGHVVGTGPFKYVSFTPGQRSVFAANEDYWGGAPYVDTLVIDSSFTDENARLNSVLSGAAQVLPLMPYVEAAGQLASGGMKVIQTPGLQSYQICMRVDVPPFNDNRVRLAMKYAVDRPGMITTALEGFGSVGNDLFGGWPGGNINLPYYDGSLQHSHDPEQAKALLKAAGKEDFTFTMPVAEGSPGFTAAATVFSQQLKASGVTANLHSIPVSSYWTVSPGNYLYRPIQLSAASPLPSLAAWYKGYLVTNAPTDETHWGTPSHDAAIAKASGATDPSTAAALWHQVQEAQFSQGGELVFGYPYTTDGCAHNVYGLRSGANYFCDNFQFKYAWLAST
jgi:peptide/nickel transport system substrate-binding protein